MFDLKSVKKKQGRRKMEDAVIDIYTFDPLDERRLPYYSTIPENRLRDARFQALSRQDKGDFLQLVDWLWIFSCGLRESDCGIVAERMGLSSIEMRVFLRRLCQAELLVECEGRFVQPELRRQFLETLRSNQNMNRKQEQRNSPPF
ncbi:hypothetical protein [Geotalea sp. SG265]|uniref:hypothetical protein n=1 Tax=Geotalea sp. SG265 TaxID=2922867 RepID=UPI001FAF7A15|nr:hypothetical protein [Geotalea sp. SG265]